MYVVTSYPFVSRTRATLRSAEFGFFGVTVNTRVQTPRFCGAPRRAGVLVLLEGTSRPFRTSWFTVGMGCLRSPSRSYAKKGRRGRSVRPEPWARIATAGRLRAELGSAQFAP